MINKDVYFRIGQSHKICQDYALCGTAKGSDYVILSDGCSSAPDTDFGARLLAKSTEPNLIRMLDSGSSFQQLYTSSIFSADTVRRGLNLSAESMCATLLTAHTNWTNFVTSISGDGLIAARRKTGEIIVVSYENDDGAPYYLRYQLDENSLLQYCNKFSEQSTVSNYVIELDGTYKQTDSHIVDFTEPFNIIWDFEKYDLVAIMSDGVKSFQKRTVGKTDITQSSVHFTEVIKELLAFKNYAGEFVQRRCQKIFSRDSLWNHYDDLSIGVLYHKED